MTVCTHRTKNFTCLISTPALRARFGSCGRSDNWRSKVVRLRKSNTPMIIDCHCHAGKGDLLTAPWNTDAPIDPYLRRAKAAGIDRTIVFAPFHSDYAQANAEVARVVAQHPARLIGFAFVHASRDAGRIYSMVRRAVMQWRFRGIKVHGHDGMITREICEVAATFKVPILIDVVGQA